MKIVILDGYAANPGDIEWETWNNLVAGDGTKCECVVYDRTAPSEVLERLQGAQLALTNKVVLTRELMSQLPELKYIGVLATGYNVVDTNAAKELGIIVTNIPAYSTMSVAQMVFAHVLNITQQVARHSASVKAGKWSTSKDFCFMETPIIELAGLTMSLVGLGNTGMATAQIAHAMGMKVLAYTSKMSEDLPEWIEATRQYDELFSRADVLSLHCPLTPETKHLVNAERLSLMKETAIVINTGRGPLVDDQALADALNNGKIYAAGVDVLTQEPPVEGSPLIAARNCFLTPHIAWASVAARKRLDEIARKNIEAFLSGTPQNVVNK